MASIALACMLCVLLALPAAAEDRCTAIAVGSRATARGGTLNTHADDCYDCDFRILRVPAASHAPNATRAIPPMKFSYPRYVGDDRGPAFTRAHVDTSIFPWSDSEHVGSIPQVPHTYSYLDGSYAISNEHGVALGESTCGARLIAAPVYAGGRALLEVSELGRLGLERARTAREAITVMGALAEKHGIFSCDWGPDDFMEGGEAYTVTDSAEAWLFHISPDDTGASAVWVAQRIPDDHVTVVTNTFRIRRVPPPEKRDVNWWMASDNIYDVARRAGLWSGNVTGTGDKDGPLDWKKHYGYSPSAYKEPYVARRTWRVFSLLAPSLNLSGSLTSWELPLSVKPDRPITVADLRSVHRDHFEGTPYDTSIGLAAGPFGNPNRYDAYGATPFAAELKRRRARDPHRLTGTSNYPGLRLRSHARDAFELGAGRRAEDVAATSADAAASAFTRSALAAAAEDGDVDNLDRSDGEPLTENELASGHFERTLSLFRTSYTVITELRAGAAAYADAGAEAKGANKNADTAASANGTVMATSASTATVAAAGLFRTWVAPHQPKTSAFVPLYPAATSAPVPAPLTTGSLFRFDQSSLWWVTCAVSNYAERAWKYVTRDIDAARVRLEAAADAEADRITAAVAQAYGYLESKGAAHADAADAADVAAAVATVADAVTSEGTAEETAEERRARARHERTVEFERLLSAYIEAASAPLSLPAPTTPAAPAADAATRSARSAADDGNAAPAGEREFAQCLAALQRPQSRRELRARADALLAAHASVAAGRSFGTYWALFWHVIAKYHDGYRLEAPRGPEFEASALFYPTWWLRAVRWWRQHPEDEAAKQIEKDGEHWTAVGDQCAAPEEIAAAGSLARSASAAGATATKAAEPTKASSDVPWYDTVWGYFFVFLLSGLVIFGAGVAVGLKYGSSSRYEPIRSVEDLGMDDYGVH
jgi:dipeptidase